MVVNTLQLEEIEKQIRDAHDRVASRPTVDMEQTRKDLNTMYRLAGARETVWYLMGALTEQEWQNFLDKGEI
jgi:hypothetical protein